MRLQPGMPIFNSVNPPVVGGTISAGTVGGLVYRQGNDTAFLSCYHCIKNEALDFRAFRRDGTNDKASTVFNFARVQFGEISQATMNTKVDFAILEPDRTGNTISGEIPEIGTITGKCLSSELKQFDKVFKFGAKSRKTSGFFWGIGSSTGVKFPPDDTMFFFENLLMFKGLDGDFAVIGDSGSFVVNERNDFVGMIIIVDDTSHITYAISADALELHANIGFAPPQQINI